MAQFTHGRNGNNPTGYNPIFRETGHPLLLLPVLFFLSVRTRTLPVGSL